MNSDTDFLTHGSLLDLSGPHFLLFYVLAVFIAWLGMFIVRRQCDPTRGNPPPPLPGDLDPRELAFLRGGGDELVRMTGLELVQRGYLKVSASGRLEENPEPPPRRQLSPAGQIILEVFKRKPSRSELLRQGKDALADEIAGYEARAHEEHFLMPPAAQKSAQAVNLLFMAVLLLIGGAKAAVAWSRGHHNIGFLAVLMIVTVFVFAKSRKLPRLSWRGQAYLKQAQSAMPDLRRQAARFATESDPALLMAAGVFGMTILDSTALAGYQQYCQPPPVPSGGGEPYSRSSGSSCSSSSSSCSSGSSCSSSSCGGGCGGGGCGGCGSS